MEDELILADLGVVERRIERLESDLKKSKTAELESERDLLLRCKEALENGQPLRALGLAGDDLRRLRGFQLLSAKPLLLVINLDEQDVSLAANVQEAAAKAGLTTFLAGAATAAVPVCAKIELEIAALEPADAASFLADLGLERVRSRPRDSRDLRLLGYVSFLTVGEDECRAWSIPRGTIAQEAAGEIHSDIARGFIRAEVVAYDALIARGIDERLPRARRSAARGQGVRRQGRRHHQLPPRHLRPRLLTLAWGGRRRIVVRGTAGLPAGAPEWPTSQARSGSLRPLRTD